MIDHRSYLHNLSRCEIKEHCTGVAEVMGLNPVQA